MILVEALRSSPGFLLFSTVLLGLAVGSFLNVVIFRIPRMLEIDCRREAREILELPPLAEESLTLASPPSRCPGCGNRIKVWHNVPVLSWLMLRGRCAACSAPISVQYPLVEAACALASAMCAWHFGWSAQLLPALALTWALLALAVIDLRTTYLPDDITLPLLWLGLWLSLFNVFASTHDALIGAIAGYLSLWLLYQTYRLATGKIGMGYGDFKLLGALGAWFGWQALPTIILLSSVVGAAVGIFLIVFKRHGRDMPIPFGPYLAGAGWIGMLWGPSLRTAYMAASGIH